MRHLFQRLSVLLPKGNAALIKKGYQSLLKLDKINMIFNICTGKLEGYMLFKQGRDIELISCWLKILVIKFL